MKILTMYQGGEGGGYFKRLIWLIEEMLKEGMELHYISTKEFPIKHENLHFHRVAGITLLKFPLFISFLPQAILKSFLLIKSVKIDKIVVFGSAYGFIGWFLKKFFDAYMILFIRGDWVKEAEIKNRNTRIIKFIERKALEAANKIYTNTKHLKESIIQRYKIDGKKIDIIYNDIPVEMRKCERKILKEGHIGFVGPLEKVKGIEFLIGGFALADINKKLVIVGSGPEEEKLKQLVKELGVRDRVDFLGWRNDIPAIMSSLELLILPSIYEGCPNVLLESLGCETPCIGSNVGGIQEILKHSELLFKPGSAHEIAKKLEEVFKNYDKVKRLCFERKEKFLFDWKKECIKLIK